MVMPKDIARSYPKRGLTADVGFKENPLFCGDGSAFFDNDNATATLSTTPGSSFSYGLWMNVSDFVPSSQAVLIEIGASGSAGSQVTITLTSTGQIQIFNGSGFIGTTAANTVELNTWHFIAVTVEGSSGGLKIYVDGVDVTGSHTATFNVTDNSMTVGAFAPSSSFYTEGNIANVFYCTEILTQDQVRQIMRFNSSAQFATITGMESFYPLSADFNDAIGSANLTNNGATLQVKKPQLPRGLDLTLGFGSPPLTFNGQCANFNGTDQGAHVSNSYNCAASGAKTTIAAWFNSRDLTAISGNETIATIAVSNTTSRFGIYTTATGEVAASAALSASTPKVSTGNILNENRWYFVAATLDADSAQLKIYLDGVEFSVTPTLGLGGTDNTFEVGFRENSGSGLQQFDGRLANVMVIEDVLTQSEIVELMRDTTYAKAQTFGTVNRFYTLASNLNDSTGSHNLTGVNSPTFTTIPANPTRFADPARGGGFANVKSGRAVDFDGSTDFLDIGLGVDKNYTTRSDRASFSVWFNTDTTSAVGFLYQNRHNNIGGTDRPECETQLFISPATGLGFDGEGAAVLIPLSNIKVGVWHHFVGVADDSDGPVKAYLDGVLYDTTTTAQAGANGNNFVIGARNNTPLQPFNGKLSHFKIFNVELTQAQVRELYHNPEMVIPTGASASNLRRHYPLCANNDTSGFGGRYESDQGVEGANGVYGGSPVMAFAQPVPCPQLGLQQSATRLYFPANVANYADFTLGSALGSSFTYATWVQPVNDNSQGLYCLFTSGASDQFGAFILSAGTIEAGNTSNVRTTETVTLGDWTHIVITGDSSSPHAKIYINGSAATLSGTIDSAGMTETGIRLGMRGASSSANRQAHCIFAESAFWDVNLSPSEVTTLYNSGVMGYDTSSVQSSQLKAWHKYDDFATLKDFSGEGRNATVSGTFTAVQFPENASGSTIVGDISMKRKGVSILNHAGADDATAIIPAQEAVYPKAGAANGYSIGFCYRKIKDGTAMVWGNTGASTNDQFMCFQQAGPNLRFNLGDGSSRPAINTSNITDSDWHHYTLTISYATTPAAVKIYVDGAVDHSSTQSITGPPALHPMHLGTGLFDGQGPVGCFKFYQVALSADEVKRLALTELRLIKGLQNE